MPYAISLRRHVEETRRRRVNAAELGRVTGQPNHEIFLSGHRSLICLAECPKCRYNHGFTVKYASEGLGVDSVAKDGPHFWQRHVSAIQAGVDSDSVNAAVGALGPLIEEMAERVCRRRMIAKQVRIDFVVDSVAYVLVVPRVSGVNAGKPRIFDYDSEDGLFPDWLKTVLDNRLIDVLKKTGRRMKHEQPMIAWEGSPTFAESIADPSPDCAGHDLDRSIQFSENDFGRIAAWPVLDRVLLFSVFELWRKVPSNIWEGWCSDADLSEPFPPEPEKQRERGEWISLIATHLSASPNALQMRLMRRLEKLRDEPLDYVQGILHDE